jgi:hypothetical protein
MRMNGTKNMRRFTSRSRLRSAIALWLIASSSASVVSSTTTLGNEERTVLQRKDIFHYITYYYLLSEIQEIRLSTSEEIILNCLSFEMTSSTNTSKGDDTTHSQNSGNNNMMNTIVHQLPSISSLKNDFNHLKALVSTWVRDEGKLQDTIELSCDLVHLFYHCHQQQPSTTITTTTVPMNNMVYDKSLFLKLIQNMVSHQQVRILFRFLQQLSVEFPGVYETILYNNELNAAIMNLLLMMFEHCIEKFHQFMKLSLAKSTSKPTANNSTTEKTLPPSRGSSFRPVIYDLVNNFSSLMKELHSMGSEEIDHLQSENVSLSFCFSFFHCSHFYISFSSCHFQGFRYER